MNCELCHNQESKYQCPRCNIKYCSLTCYRSENHSQCSEAFYKECVMNELQSQQCNSDEKLKIMEMLQRTEDDGAEEWEDLDSDDDENEADLADRLQDVDLNNADEIWDRLTDAEKEEFKTIVHSGKIDKIVTPIEPYWKQKINQLVIEVEESERRIKEIQDNCPPVIQNIKNFQSISTKPPAKCIVLNVTNVIAAYCYIYRLYNGDHHNYQIEASNIILSICDNLKANVNFENISTIVDSTILNCHNSQLHADNETKAVIHEDLTDIFNGPNDEHSKMFLLAALSDVISLFEAARIMWKEHKSKKKSTKSKGFSSQFPSYAESTENYKELHNQTHFLGCQKKLEFYLSFGQHCYNKTDWSIERF